MMWGRPFSTGTPKLTRESEEKNWDLLCLYDIHQYAKLLNIWLLVRCREDDERRVREVGKGGVQLKQPRGDAHVCHVVLWCEVVEQLVSPVGVVFKIPFGHICRLRSAKLDLFREEDREALIIRPGLKECGPAGAKSCPSAIELSCRVLVDSSAGSLVHQQGKGGRLEATPGYRGCSEGGGTGGRPT